jgi:zeaxanthin glucosyltransferase
MPTFLFLINPTTSHINSSVTLAKFLQSKKHRVVYAVPNNEIKRHVEAIGFGTLLINSVPFGLEFELILNRIKKSDSLYLDVLIDKLSHTVFKQRKSDLCSLINKYNFSHLVLDSFYSSDLIVLNDVLAKMKMKVLFLQTMLSTYQHRISPPLNSNYSSSFTLTVNFLWYLFYLKRGTLRLIKKLLFLGRDDWSMLKLKFKESNLPQRGIELCSDTILSCAFEGYPELITAPIELEYFNSPSRKSQHYLGLCIDTNRLEKVHDNAFNDFYEAHSDVIYGKSLIYCAFGSRFEEFGNKVRSIVDKLLQIAAGRSDLIFVFSMGSLKNEYLGTTLPNTYFFEMVPQLKMLSICKVFISHGGLNSIKEGIFAKVPMIVFPLDNNWDQPGNAERVRSLRIGAKANHKTSTNSIEALINDLINSAMYRDNVNALREKIDRNTSQSDFEKVIQSVL